MKLTKNWGPLLGIYLVVGGLVGLVLSTGSCTCDDEDYWWLAIGLFIGTIVWIVDQWSREGKELGEKKIEKRRKTTRRRIRR